MADVTATDADREAGRTLIGTWLRDRDPKGLTDRVIEAIARARAEEREACAKVCEAQGPPADTRHNPLYRDAFDDGVCTCADAIRARGEQGGK